MTSNASTDRKDAAAPLTAPSLTAPTLTAPDSAILAVRREKGGAPGIVFLGGFRSDMTGAKATYLRDWAIARGRAIVTFDYSGHGASGGKFFERRLGDWAAEAILVLDRLTEGPQILVGSSMGGWLMLLVALARPERIAALVGIAAAPDFTEELILPAMTPSERAALARDGRIDLPSAQPSAHGEGFALAAEFFTEARRHLVLGRRLNLPMKLRLLHGITDTEVPFDLGLRLLQQADSPDATLTLVKGGDHRLSRPQDLALLGATLDGLGLA